MQHSKDSEPSPFARSSPRSMQSTFGNDFHEPSSFVTNPIQINGPHPEVDSLASSDSNAGPTILWRELGKTLPPLFPKHTKQVLFKKLCVTQEQHERIVQIYQDEVHFAQEYTENDQGEATQMLFKLGLDHSSRENLESRWSVRNSYKSGETRRILFQCGCGYDSKARQKQEEARDTKQSSGEWERQVPYPFTACLAHIEIIEKGNGVVTWIAGVPEHNDACKSSFLERRPPVPLHEHVYEVALEQLQNGASYSITAIQDKNREMIASKSYRGIENYEPTTANVRYLFLPSDHASLYRKATKSIGVDARQLPQYNVEDWLAPNSPNYKPEVAQAVFHYSARAEVDDRFEICISTPEMDQAARKYAHHSQFIL
ncbi:hypothetical protein EV360DRAFT_69588, partial [Lentinula raphanica]